MADYFIFNDFDSRNHGIFIHDGSQNGRSRQFSPSKASILDRPIGTSGMMLFDQYYDERNIPLELFLDNENATENDFRAISSYISGLGIGKLVLSYEQYKYYNCIMDNQLDMVQYTQGGIYSTLEFKCINPFGFSQFTTQNIQSGLIYNTGWQYDSGLLYREDMGDYTFTNIVNNQSISIYNGSNCNFASPVFKFSGQATTLKVEQFSDITLLNKIGEFTYGNFTGILDVNFPLFSCFKNGIIDNTTFNSNGIWLLGRTNPVISNGGSIVSYSGNTITLPSSASSVNGYYNGMSIYMNDNANCMPERREITAYNGATKVLTLSSPFTSINFGDSYNIYSPKDGKNYFKISGTGFVNLGLTVDFRYVYL